jgi:hypothetical protein
LTEDENGEPIQPISVKLFIAILDVTRLAVQHGVILDRWLDFVSIMIEKIPGRPLITKPRVIHLVKADFNLILGILWGRRLMAQAERLRALDDQQFGSRKGRSAEEVALLKHATYELMKITRTNGGTFDNDAKACYNRIIPNLMSLCGQRLGLSEQSMKLHTEVLRRARYHLKSDDSYSHPTRTPSSAPGKAALPPRLRGQ